MSTDRFPESIDPQKIFARQGSIVSEVPLSRFSRLRDSLSNTEGKVAVQLDFGHDDNGRRRISGQLQARLYLQCQRCLEDMPFDLDATMDVLVLGSHAAARALPQEVDAVVHASDEDIDLLGLVEDELILSLPIVPMHADEGCNEDLERLGRSSGTSGGQENGVREDSPFAKLRELKVGKGKPEQG